MQSTKQCSVDFTEWVCSDCCQSHHSASTRMTKPWEVNTCSQQSFRHHTAILADGPTIVNLLARAHSCLCQEFHMKTTHRNGAGNPKETSIGLANTNFPRVKSRPEDKRNPCFSATHGSFSKAHHVWDKTKSL